MLSSWYTRFSSQPHNPFFANGIIFFTLFMALFLAVYSGFINTEINLLTYHAYALIFVVFTQFFLGFLFVVFPRFLMQAQISQKVYMSQFLIYFIGSILFITFTLFIPKLIILAAIIIFIGQVTSVKTLYEIHKSSLMAKDKKYDTKWALIAFTTGAFANLLYIISMLDFQGSIIFSKLGINAGFYLYLFVMIFAISQRMIPFFTQVKIQTYVINKSKYLLEFVYLFLVVKVFLLVFADIKYNFIADIPLFILFTRELIKWKLPFFKLPAIMWVLYLGLYWIPIAFFISIVESFSNLFMSDVIFFEKSVLHTMALGYFLTVLIGFGTRVVLGHSNRTPTSDKITTFMFIFIQIIVLSRFLTSMSINFDLDYILFLNITASLLIIALIAWSFKYLFILLNGK